MADLNLEVATVEIRKLVKEFKEKGFPKSLSLEEAEPSLTEKQREVLTKISDLGIAERMAIIAAKKNVPQKDDEWWKIRENLHKLCQEAIGNGLINLKLFQEKVIHYGAIPDPKENWKYYLLPDFTYACWDCGEGILAAQVIHPIWDGPFPLSGSGRCSTENVPYCPKCELKPSSRGTPISPKGSYHNP